MSEKELLGGLPPYLFAAAATISFALALYLALHDRIKSGSLLGAIAFVAALLAYLPQLESLSAFAVNVKLRNSLDRAEEILTRLRSLSVVNAKLAYTTLAWGNRLGAPKATEKQRLLDAMDEQLAALNVSPDNETRNLPPLGENPGTLFTGCSAYQRFLRLLLGATVEPVDSTAG